MSYWTRVRDAWRTRQEAQEALMDDYESRKARAKKGDPTAFDDNDPTYQKLNRHSWATRSLVRDAILNREHFQDPNLRRIYDFEEHLGDTPNHLYTLCGIEIDQHEHDTEKLTQPHHDRCADCAAIAEKEAIDWDLVQ